MREILFRGKQHSGEWVYGYLVKMFGGIGIIPLDNENEFNPIDSSTVGQFTGQMDKHDKQLFDGDICKFYHYSENYIGKIVVNSRTACFEMWANVTVGAYGEKATMQFLMTGCSNIEKVGNVYDNPELLGGASDA